MADSSSIIGLRLRLKQYAVWSDGSIRMHTGATKLVCIPWREARVSLMFRRNWVVETDPRKADFLIGTERWNCGEGKDVVLLDRVERFGRAFAWTYANKHAASE